MMRSATAFLPDSMITFMNLDRSTDPNLGSGRISRLGTSRRRGISFPFNASVGAGDLPTSRNSTQGCSTYSVHAGPSGHDRHLNLRSGLFRALGAVLRARLLAVLDALQVKRATHDVVTHTGQVLHTTAANQHDAVFLQVVAFTADVGDDLKTVGQAHLGDLTQSGVRLLRRGGVHAGAHATALRAVFHRRRLGLRDLDLTAMAHELIDRWHFFGSR